MIVRAGSGWQTLLADLAIILFMVTAAALSQAKDGSQPALPRTSPRSEPLAIWHSATGAPKLADWLAAQAPDPRQQLTIVAHYRPGGQHDALARAGTLLASAGAAGLNARLVIEPGADGIVATLAYDSAGPQLAQGLQSPDTDMPARDSAR